MSATASARGASGSGLDPEHCLLRDPAVACLLTPADERLELVVQRFGVLQARVHDLEAEVAHRIALSEPLEHHLADALRGHLRRAALLDRRFKVVDETLDVVWEERLRTRLADRRRELAAIELLFRAVALEDLDAGRLGALARGEALAAFVAGAPAADGLTIFCLTRVDDAWGVANMADEKALGKRTPVVPTPTSNFQTPTPTPKP